MTHKFALFLSLLLASLSAGAFEVVDSRGKSHRLADYKGKWVLVNFWATWCPPCLEEIPDLVALHDNKKNNLTVIGIALDYSNPKQVLDYSEQMRISYPIVLGDYRMASKIGTVSGLPTTYLYNPEGKMVAYNVGALTSKAVESYIAKNGSTARKDK